MKTRHVNWSGSATKCRAQNTRNVAKGLPSHRSSLLWETIYTVSVAAVAGGAESVAAAPGE